MKVLVTQSVPDSLRIHGPHAMEAAGPPGRSMLIGRAFAGGVGVLAGDSEAGDTGAPGGKGRAADWPSPGLGRSPIGRQGRDIVRAGGNPEPGRGGSLRLQASRPENSLPASDAQTPETMSYCLHTRILRHFF